jgi:hypothetical protein
MITLAGAMQMESVAMVQLTGGISQLPASIIVIEDGSATTIANTPRCANSYQSLAAADAYMETRSYAANWWNASQTQQICALLDACRILDIAFIWMGWKTLRDSPMRWPRTYCPDPDTRLGYYPAIAQPSNVIIGNTGGLIWPAYYPSDYIPPRLIYAQTELALRVLGTYAQTMMLGNQPYQDPAVEAIDIGQGAVSIRLAPINAVASGGIGLIDDEIIRLCAGIGQPVVGGAGTVKRLRRV